MRHSDQQDEEARTHDSGPYPISHANQNGAEKHKADDEGVNEKSNSDEMMQQLQARAAARAAQEIGLSHDVAMAAMPLLHESNASTPPCSTAPGDAAVEAAKTAAKEVADSDDHSDADKGGETDGGQAVPEAAQDAGVAGGSQPGEQSFTCTVCRKVFKREMNLIFHMTTHRPRQPQAEAAEAAVCQPVKCHECGKEFATKYQAKKHYLRRHFQGDKPFACPKCHKKRFVVKEDLTMHMKSCGNVYVCTCGIRLCSLGALKRHCKYFSHEPESLEPQPDPSSTHLPQGTALEWNGIEPNVPDRQLAGVFPGGLHSLHSLPAGSMGPAQHPAQHRMGGHAMQQLIPSHFSASDLLRKLQPQCGMPQLPGVGPTHSHPVAGAPAGSFAPNICAAAAHPSHPMGCGAPAPSTSAAASLMWSMMGSSQPHPAGRDEQQGPGAIPPSQWTPEMLSGMMPSLAQALRQAQGARHPMPERTEGLPQIPGQMTPAELMGMRVSAPRS